MTPAVQKSFARALLLNRVAWFDVLISTGQLDRWLTSTESADFLQGMLVLEQPEILQHRGDKVAERIKPIIEGPEIPKERRDRALRLFGFTWFHGSPELFALFVSALARGDFENIAQDWGTRLYQLPERNPAGAIQVLVAIFDRALATAKTEEGPDFSRFHFPEDFVGQISRNQPEPFARAFLPRIVALVRKHEIQNEDIGMTDRIWPVLMQGISHDLKWVLLDRLAQSLGLVATQNPELLDSLVDGLESFPHRNIGYLLLSGWTANPARYADRIVSHLLRHPALLGLGYASWGEGNGEAAISRSALLAATPYCTPENLRGLETAILHYYPTWEKEEPRRFGYVQALLLHSIDHKRISQEARSRLEQLDRKFPHLNLEPPTQSRGFVSVESPIPKEKIPKMSDENWLSAMRAYHAESGKDPARWLQGGVHELSGQLEILGRNDKTRFARLALKMGSDIAPGYFSALLRALVATSDDTQSANRGAGSLPPLASGDLFPVFRHVHDLEGHPCGQWLVWAIGSVADRVLPDDILEIVAYYAVHGSTPKSPGGLTGKAFGGNLVNHGINTVRGAAADCLTKLLYSQPTRWAVLKPAILSTVRDPAWSVQAVGVSCLTAMLNVDRELAVRIFIEETTKNDDLLGSAFVPRFLLFAAQTHYAALRESLLKMLGSSDGEANEGAAQAITVAAFRVEQALGDIPCIRSGPEEGRVAWAHLAASSLRVSELAPRCREWLRECFADASPKVREAAGRCFHELSSDQLCREGPLIDAFLESPAFEHAAAFLLMGLEKAVDRLPDVVCRIPEQALKLFQSENGKGQQTWWTHQMSTLVLRLYRQTREASVRKHCLDAIDSMIELGLGNVGSELEKLERR